MLAIPNPQRDFIELLFERILFEELQSNGEGEVRHCFDPTRIAIIFRYIHDYYSELGIKDVHTIRENAISNLGLFTPRGIRIFLINSRDRFKLIPISVIATFDLGNETEVNPQDHVGCRPVTGEQVMEFQSSFLSVVDKDYRNEIDLLVNMVKSNGLFEKQIKTSSSSTADKNKTESRERYLSRLEKTRLAQADRLKIEQTLVQDIKDLTLMDVIVISSFASGINISDHDVELLLVESSLDQSSFDTPMTDDEASSQSDEMSPKRIMTMDILISTLKSAGYKSVHIVPRYSDLSCDINPSYASFNDYRSGRSCQITLENPLALPLRELIQAYASIDDRLEKLVYGIQQVTLEYGRCERFLGNYAITLMAIAYMQAKKLLPKLQYRRGASADQSRPQNLQLKPVTSNMTANQRKANARQNKKLRGLVAAGGGGASSTKTEIIQTPTIFGTHRGIDCLFQRYTPESQSSIKRGNATADDLLSGFLNFFVSETNFFSGDQISIIEGPVIPYRDFSANSMMRSHHNPNQRQPNSRVLPHHRLRFGQPVGFNVSDPFVAERNITNSCTGWRLEASLVSFQKALQGLSSSGNIFDIIAAYNENDDDSDDCGVGLIHIDEDFIKAMTFLSLFSDRD